MSTTIDVSAIEEPKLQTLAAKATLRGMLVDYAGQYYRVVSGAGRVKAYDFELTSVSDPSRFHSVTLFKVTDRWYAVCDEDKEDGCEANRLGGKLCSHVATAYIELKKELERGRQVA